ncbi:MAG: 4Fe-4S dicluster domain-containing protein [Actinobacteria bacterium]|nr:4Fe-4S dicluster domain-containing protein [Actinomycetota bacterium]MBU1943190.1 4Fe-4S dicluster domain-containing protein [Actinomycetota bacterium]MBU2687868.1 4Fe-4S dicluster domain-containing protein [Actinomycetota bacterium]
MADRKPDIDEKLSHVAFDIDAEAHITVKKERCGECRPRPCLSACPAENYTWNEAKDELLFNYEGCLECGTCRFVCPLDAIEWSYPRGGFGVRYRYG